MGEQTLHYDELQTVFFEGTEVVNERPLAINTSEDGKHNYLCPNRLLLGRATARIPAGPWVTSKRPLRRLKYVQSVVDKFWREWNQVAFPKLVTRGKWHTERRNLRVNDGVLIKEESAVRSLYQMGIIVEVFPDKEGKVRRAKVAYKTIGVEPARVYKKGKKYLTYTRDVRSLVLLLPAEEQKEGLFDSEEEVPTK